MPSGIQTSYMENPGELYNRRNYYVIKFSSCMCIITITVCTLHLSDDLISLSLFPSLLGQNYSGTSRKAYLPHNESGRKLLARLKFAFTHGLVFRIGSSLTTGKFNLATDSLLIIH